MATAGNQASPLVTLHGDRTRTGTGPIPTLAGRGCRTKTSVGPPITTVAGCASKTRAGSGCPDTNGARRGSPGAQAAIMWAGRLCLQLAKRVYEGRPITGHVDVEFDIGPLYYNFVDVRYVGEPRLIDRIYPSTQNITVIEQTVNVTNITYTNSVFYNYGPDYNVISRYSVQPIRRLRVERAANVSVTAGVQVNQSMRVESDKLVVTAPAKIRQSAQNVAPKTVKAKIAQPKIERGWSGISDPKVKTQLVQKMKTEDAKNVPPPKASPNQQAAGGASPAAGAPPTPPTNASPAAVGAAAPTPAAKTAAATATPPPATPAATAAITPQHAKRGRAAAAAAAGAAINEQNQATPAQTEHGQHGKAAARPTMTPSAEKSATEQTPPQSRRDRVNARRAGRGLEEQSPTPKATPNAQEHNAAAGAAPEDQAAGKKREHNATNPGEGQQHQQQNELAPTGQSTNAEMHQHHANKPHVQGQPPTTEGTQQGGHKKKGGEESPTPKPQ